MYNEDPDRQSIPKLGIANGLAASNAKLSHLPYRRAGTFEHAFVLKQDVYNAIAALGIKTLMVHGNDLLLDRYQQWSVIYGHQHIIHMCKDPSWDYYRDLDDDVSHLHEVNLIIAIDCEIPNWLQIPASRVQQRLKIECI